MENLYYACAICRINPNRLWIAPEIPILLTSVEKELVFHEKSTATKEQFCPNLFQLASASEARVKPSAGYSAMSRADLLPGPNLVMIKRPAAGKPVAGERPI